MSDTAIVNASPLIFLSKVEQINLLQLVASQIRVPEEVATEIKCRGANDVTARILADTSWLPVVSVPLVPYVIQSWDLGPVESAVLAYALAHTGTVAIIDDGSARRCAETLGVPLSGTLGLVMTAKKRGLITAARPVIETLKQHGMFLSERTIDQAMSLIGE